MSYNCLFSNTNPPPQLNALAKKLSLKNCLSDLCGSGCCYQIFGSEAASESLSQSVERIGLILTSFPMRVGCKLIINK